MYLLSPSAATDRGLSVANHASVSPPAEVSPGAIAYAALKGTTRRFKQNADELIVYETEGREKSLSEEEKFRLGRFTSEDRAESLNFNSPLVYLDRYSRNRLRVKGFTLGSKGLDISLAKSVYDEEWLTVDRALEELKGPFIGRVAAKLVWRNPFGEKFAVRGSLGGRTRLQSIAGFIVDFEADRPQRNRDKARAVQLFNGILSSQHERNVLAARYENLPRPEPMAEATFVALFEELAKLYPLLRESEHHWLPLRELMGGAAPSRLRVTIEDPLTQSLKCGNRLTFQVIRCEHCGHPKELSGFAESRAVWGKSWRAVDGSAASRVLEENHVLGETYLYGNGSRKPCKYPVNSSSRG